MDTREWLNNVTNGDSLRTIEKKTGVSYGTINSQRTTGVSAENVIAVARGYGIPPVSALVVTEFLTPAEVDKGDPKAAIRDVTEEDLAEEVLRRMKLLGDHREFTTPVDELIEERGNVTPMRHTDVLAPLPDLENLDYVAQHDTNQPTNDECAEHHNGP